MVICQDQFYTPSVRKKGLKGLLTMFIETLLRLMYGVPYDQKNCEKKGKQLPMQVGGEGGICGIRVINKRCSRLASY